MDSSSDGARVDGRALAQKALERYGDNILRLAYSYVHNMDDAQDVLQETLLQVMRSCPVFASDEHERGWLFRVAISKAQDRLRSQHRHAADELDENIAAAGRPDLDFVWQAVRQLPAKYAGVIHLFYQEGYSTAEIGRIMRIRESTVRSLLHRGRLMLKDVLKEAYDFGNGQE